MDEKQYTVGEIANATGLTVRTLQHYDNIGLLPVSGRSEAGRRYYTHNDLLKLEQIIFYKSIGIPLKGIEEKMIDTQSLSELETSLKNHYGILLQKINALNLAMSVLESSLEVIQSGKYPPWEKMALIIRAMDGSSLSEWENFKFDDKLFAVLEEKGMTTIGGAMEFYHSMRALMVEAATLQAVASAPDSLVAKKLAERWWNLIMNMASGDEDILSALSKVNSARESWPVADRKLFEEAEPFLEAVLAIYIRENNIVVPDAILRKEIK